MLDKDGKPIRVIFRPTREADREIDTMMGTGKFTSKSALLNEAVLVGIQALKKV